MRAVSRVVVGAVLGCALAACGPGAPPSTVVPISDAGRDASRRDGDAGFDDGGFDAGPPADPVLPAQSWDVSFIFNDFAGAWTIETALLLDARAESGSVRAVMGANGRSNSIVFDVVAPGRLVSRNAVDLGISIPSSDCRAPIARMTNLILTFRDHDGDGAFEELSSLSSDILTVDALGNVSGAGALFGVMIEADTSAPTLTALPEHPIGAIETLRVIASEPLDPGTVPYVEGDGRRFALRETPGSSASHWSLDLSSLPTATGYALHFDGEVRDLAGNPARILPETTFDVGAIEPLRPDGFETGLSGIDADEGVRALVGDEVPLAGLTSAFSTSRTLVTFTPPRSASVMMFMFRMHADTMETFSPWFRVMTTDGRVVGLGSSSAFVYQPSTVAGFAFQTDPTFASIAFPPGSEQLVLEIDLRGSADITCSGITRTAEGVPLAITLDSFEAR